MSTTGKHFYDFGPFRLNVTQRVLLLEARPVALGAKAFQMLLALVENHGNIVTRKELVKLVWPASESLHESNLNQQIRNVRLALGDDALASPSQYIQTIPGEGYIFVADVKERWETLSEPQPAKRYSLLWPAVAAVSVLGALVTWLVASRLPVTPIAPPVQLGRVFVRSNSEGRRPTRITLTHFASSLAFSPDGTKLFVTSAQSTASRTLSIVNTVDLTVRTVALPSEPRALTTSPDGKLYISSQAEGIMVFDIARDRLIDNLIPTHGSVWDMAVTPDGKRIFLAMSQFGVRRLLVRTGDLKQITDQQCPQHLELDPLGRRLFVTYQCGGPGGRRGHDSLEIFDAEKEETLGVFSGPPMVGGHPSVAPDGQLVTLDGLDACQNPMYDQFGCPLTPSHVFHLFRPADRQIIRSFSVSPVASGGPATFVDSSRFLLAGDSLTMIDATSGAIREKWAHRLGDYPIAIRAPDGHRLFVGGDHSILVLELEDHNCSPPQNGLAQFYSGDGTMDDGASATELTPRGDVAFVPGKIGQAFFFNKASFLEGPKTANYFFGVHDSTLAFYVKFASLAGEMALLEREATDGNVGFALVKSADNRFLFHVATASGPLTLVSDRRAIENRWYHLVVSKTDRDLSFYIDGELERQSSSSTPMKFPTADDIIGPLQFGAGVSSRSPLKGWLDELAFYDRAISREEIKDLYRSRESGPCAVTKTSQ